MRVNFFGGANTGKSTTAPGVFSALKKTHFNVEYIPEYIKLWAYQGKVPKSFDPFYIFAKHLHAEDNFLQAGVEHIVSDSPLLIQVFYAKKHGFVSWEAMHKTALDFENKYPSLNIFLDRTGIPYNQHGRYETEEQAMVIDQEMKELLDYSKVPYTLFKTVDEIGITEFVKMRLAEVTNAKPVV